MARPFTGGKFPVPMSTRFTTEEADAIDKALHGASRSEWLHAAALSVLGALEAEPAKPPGRRRKTDLASAECTRHVPPGAYCKTCDRIHK